jgi:integrase/recombinase XerC
MTTIEAAFEEFLLDTRSRLSNRTTTWYRLHLRDLVDRLQGTPVDQVQSLAIRQYLIDLRTAESHRRGSTIVPGPISPETQRGRHRALKTFFNWCVLEYDLDPKVNPMRKIKALPAAGHEPKAVSLDDVSKVLAVIEDTTNGKRDRAILYFMLDTGCRAGGIVGLTMDRLDMEHRRAIVVEKGDRARVVPFTELTAAAIRDWLAVRPEFAQTLFCDLGMEVASVGGAITTVFRHFLLLTSLSKVL